MDTSFSTVWDCHENAAALFGRRNAMSPTIFRNGSFRFYFFSREEPRMHVHVQCPDGEAKFWLEPEIVLAHNYGLDDQQVRAAQALVEGNAGEIRSAWQRYFGR